MPRRCALGCTPSKGVLHVFPNPNKFSEQFNAWVRVVGRQDETDLDYKKLRICDRHFTEQDRNRNNRLNALAVPSLFLHEHAMQTLSEPTISMSCMSLNQPEVTGNDESSPDSITHTPTEKYNLVPKPPCASSSSRAELDRLHTFNTEESFSGENFWISVNLEVKMGKRTKEKTNDEIRSKIKRLEKELKSRQKSPPPFQNEDSEHDSYYEHDVEFEDGSKGGDDTNEYELSAEHHWPESVVEVPGSIISSLIPEIPSPEKLSEEPHKNSTSAQGEENAIPLEVLAVLGEAKQSEETFGKKIPAEVSERWGKILLEGLSKDQKENLLTKTLIPENFQLAKAPKLNAEVASVLNEPTKNRDKRLEKMQNQLGSSIAGLANLTSELINKDLSKIEIIKQIAEINQILLDLHYEETMNRRRLIIPLLDKRFLTIIQGVKRDTFLFGDNLGENIKMTKLIEQSSWQIKKSIASQQSTPRRLNTIGAAQGNARVLPRQTSGRGTARAPPARYYPPPHPHAGSRMPPASRRVPP